MEPIEPYDKPSPKDRLDTDAPAGESVEDALDTWEDSRRTAAHAGPVGEITNPDVTHQEAASDPPETDPFDDASRQEV